MTRPSLSGVAARPFHAFSIKFLLILSSDAAKGGLGVICGMSSNLLDLPSHDQDVHIARILADCTYDWKAGSMVRVASLGKSGGRKNNGWSIDECLHMSDYPLALTVSDDREKVRHILDRARSGQTGNDETFRIVRKEGTICWVSIAWQPLILPMVGSTGSEQASETLMIAYGWRLVFAMMSTGFVCLPSALPTGFLSRMPRGG